MKKQAITPGAEEEAMFLSVDQVAKRYNVSTDSIWRWVRNKNFPSPFRIGAGITRWRRADIEQHDSTLRCCFMTCAALSLAA